MKTAIKNLFTWLRNIFFGRATTDLPSSTGQTTSRGDSTPMPKVKYAPPPSEAETERIPTPEVVEKPSIQLQIPPNMRTVNRIIIHSTATPEGRHHTIDEIRRWHTLPPPQGNGWRDIGYHYVIYLDGSIHKGRPIGEIGAHVANHNTGSIGIAYVGGTDAARQPKDTRTSEQRVALSALLSELQNEFPNATIHGHNEFAATACPSFNVQTQL